MAHMIQDGLEGEFAKLRPRSRWNFKEKRMPADINEKPLHGAAFQKMMKNIIRCWMGESKPPPKKTTTAGIPTGNLPATSPDTPPDTPPATSPDTPSDTPPDTPPDTTSNKPEAGTTLRRLLRSRLLKIKTQTKAPTETMNEENELKARECHRERATKLPFDMPRYGRLKEEDLVLEDEGEEGNPSIKKALQEIGAILHRLASSNPKIRIKALKQIQKLGDHIPDSWEDQASPISKDETDVDDVAGTDDTSVPTPIETSPQATRTSNAAGGGGEHKSGELTDTADGSSFKVNVIIKSGAHVDWLSIDTPIHVVLVLFCRLASTLSNIVDSHAPPPGIARLHTIQRCLSKEEEASLIHRRSSRSNQRCPRY